MIPYFGTERVLHSKSVERANFDGQNDRKGQTGFGPDGMAEWSRRETITRTIASINKLTLLYFTLENEPSQFARLTDFECRPMYLSDRFLVFTLCLKRVFNVLLCFVSPYTFPFIKNIFMILGKLFLDQYSLNI